MNRTSILIPPDLRNRADRMARQLGISFGELVRRALGEMLDRPGTLRTGDAFLAEGPVYDGPGPSDTSVHHDDYLYGEDR